jgi:hypothetical protein
MGNQLCADRPAAVVGGEPRRQRPLQVPRVQESRGLAYPRAGLAADVFRRQHISADQGALICGSVVCELLLPVPLAAASTRWPYARPQRPGALPLGAEPYAAGD